jgi:long-subunit acyl-CoA synthetase (AMP-forming)
LKDENPPFFYGLAKKIILDKVKDALGLSKCDIFIYGAAPMK